MFFDIALLNYLNYIGISCLSSLSIMAYPKKITLESLHCSILAKTRLGVSNVNTRRRSIAIPAPENSPFIFNSDRITFPIPGVVSNNVVVGIRLVDEFVSIVMDINRSTGSGHTCSFTFVVIRERSQALGTH